MRPFGFLLKNIRTDICEFANSAFRRRGVKGEGARTDHADEREIPNGRLPDDWFSAAARMYLGGSVTSSPEGIVRAVEAAFAAPDSVLRGAYWWFIAEAWGRGGHPAELPRQLGAVLAARFSVDAKFEALEQVARMWMDGICDVVNEENWRLRSDAENQRLMEDLAGGDRPTIERSVADATQFLAHPASGRRIAAIKVIAGDTGRPRWFPDKLREMVLNDPDPQVRANAIVHLTTMFAGTRDARTLSFIARVALDDTQTRQLRFFAYHGLFVVSGAPSEEWPYGKVLLESCDQGVSFLIGKNETWPCEMDWSFVTSFLGPDSEPSS